MSCPVEARLGDDGTSQAILEHSTKIGHVGVCGGDVRHGCKLEVGQRGANHLRSGWPAAGLGGYSEFARGPTDRTAQTGIAGLRGRSLALKSGPDVHVRQFGLDGRRDLEVSFNCLLEE